MAIQVADARVLPLGASTTEPDEKHSFLVGLLRNQSGMRTAGGRFSRVSLPATPGEVLLGNLHHPTLRLTEPIALEVSRDDGLVTVWSSRFDEIGYGQSLGAAIEDFQTTLAELYAELQGRRDSLGPDLRRVLDHLNQVIQDHA